MAALTFQHIVDLRLSRACDAWQLYLPGLGMGCTYQNDGAHTQ